MTGLSDMVRGRYNRCKYCGAYNPTTGKCDITGRKVVSDIVANTRVTDCPKDKRWGINNPFSFCAKTTYYIMNKMKGGLYYDRYNHCKWKINREE